MRFTPVVASNYQQSTQLLWVFVKALCWRVVWRARRGQEWPPGRVVTSDRHLGGGRNQLLLLPLRLHCSLPALIQPPAGPSSFQSFQLTRCITMICRNATTYSLNCPWAWNQLYSALWSFIYFFSLFFFFLQWRTLCTVVSVWRGEMCIAWPGWY